ncbi:MAG: molecular chaperone GroEL [Clostridiales bacterium]|nr:molecular chaperone GroEL [Clostridiales bacterium]
MQNKELLFNKDAREAMLKGMEVLATAVSSTLGPKGQCVVIDEYRDEKPLITKDGVSVAKNIQLKNKFENLGVQLLREASVRTVETAGDATTTTVVLAYEMIKTADELIKSGTNPIQLKNLLKPYFENVVQNLKDQAIPIGDGDIERIARISSNNDSEIGKLIAEAFEKVGKDGVITVQESPTIWTYTDIITGMQFDRGMESEFFATDPIKQICELEEPYILITDQKIQLMRDIVPILEIAARKHKPILLIAQDYDDEVITNLKINVMQGRIKLCAIKTPSYGEYRKFILDDLAILTDSTVISYESGIELPKVTEDMLGKCEKVTVTKESTTIIGGHGSKVAISKRVDQIREQLKQVSDTLDADFLREFHSQRLAKLTGGVCSIYVGGTTELEMKEKRDRIEDAVCATKAAIEEGYVAGGGVSFIKAILPLMEQNLSKEVNAILTSLFAVQERIIANAGGNFKDYESDPDIGFDANKMEWVNMIEAGIINPAKSDRLALENAISVLNLYLSSSCLIVNEEIQF